MSKVTTRREGSIAVLTLDDGKVNAIQQGWLDELNAALDASLDAKAVVLTGRPGYFSAGLDMKTLPSLSREELRATLGSFTETMLRVFHHPRPVVAAISGHAIAGGCVLALGADCRLMAEGPFAIGLNEVVIGITLPSFVIDFARAALPAHRHVDAILHGRIYPPQEALDVGYLEAVHPQDALLDKALERARDLADLPDPAYAATKQSYRGSLLAGSAALADDELDGFVNAIKPA